MHTFGLLWCLLSWSSHKKHQGGFKNAVDKRRVSEMLSAIYSNGIHKQCELSIELVDAWEMTWPRPANRYDVEIVKLKVRRGGVLYFKSWFDCCYIHSAPGGVLGPIPLGSWDLVHLAGRPPRPAQPIWLAWPACPARLAWMAHRTPWRGWCPRIPAPLIGR